MAVGYFEADSNFDAVCAKMDQTEVNAKWQTEMSVYTPANDIAIDGAKELEQYFYLGANREDNVVVDGDAGGGDNAVSTPAWTPQDWTGGGELTASGLKRTCFQMRFEAEDLGQYLKVRRRTRLLTVCPPDPTRLLHTRATLEPLPLWLWVIG